MNKKIIKIPASLGIILPKKNIFDFSKKLLSNDITLIGYVTAFLIGSERNLGKTSCESIIAIGIKKLIMRYTIIFFHILFYQQNQPVQGFFKESNSSARLLGSVLIEIPVKGSIPLIADDTLTVQSKPPPPPRFTALST